MSMKKKFSLIILLLFIFNFVVVNLSFCSLDDSLKTLDSSIGSEAALVMEASTGKVLYEKNSTEIKYPASTTKIMTAILAIENCNLNDVATVSNNAITSIPSGYTVANIQIGEKLSIENLLYALMLKSANEAAVVLAEHISGSVDNFAELMNKKAKEIGCTNTNFVNPNGVHNDKHYTTAHDLALIAQYCMKNETFRKIVSTTSYTLPATDIYKNNDRTFTNTNDLIIVNTNDRKDNYYYPYAIGIKTGFTSNAKNCLVACANKNGIELITVVLGASLTPEGLSHRYEDTINMFEFGFNNYSFKKIHSSGDIAETNINIENATDDTKNLDAVLASDVVLFASSDNNDVKTTINLKDNLVAPISKGDVIGTATYELDGLSYTTDLLASQDVEKDSGINIFLILLIIILIGGCGFIIYRRQENLKKYRRNKYKYVNKNIK